MFMHNKRLQYTVRVSEPNPHLATLMLEQFGGADGELAAAMRYFTQGLGEDDAGRKDMLLDIATEELSHLEVIGTLARAHLKPTKVSREAADADPLIAICGGGGVSLCNSVGNAWTADYLKITGELDVDLRSNIAAEARAKIVYERLIDFCDDPGSKDALQFLMTREITHMKAFMTALAAMEKPPLAVELIPPSPKIVDQYFNTSTGVGDQGEQDLLAPWNDDATVERIDAPAFQSLADPQLGTRRAEPIEGPDLSSPTQEAAQPIQMEHAGEGAKRQRAGQRGKSKA